MTDKIYIKWDKVYRACQAICRDVVMGDVKEYDYIVGTNRGGLIPAVIISHMLKVPHLPISYSSPDGTGDDKNSLIDLPKIRDSKILIIDDICDSGLTMQYICRHYGRKMGNTVRSAVIYVKEHSSKHIPDFHAFAVINEKQDWIVFPWEQ